VVPARTQSSRAALAATCALLLLTTGCAARFDRPVASAGGQSQTGIDGLTADQGGQVPTTTSSGQPLSNGQSPTSPVVGGGSVPPGGGPGTTTTNAGRGSQPGTQTGNQPTRPGSATAPTATNATTGPVAAGSTTGVTKTDIKIALFVPKTGAAPVPPTIDAQAQNYWDYVKSKGGIYGRNVTLKIYDTGSTAAGAKQAVLQAQSDGVFAAISLDRIAVEGALVTALHQAGIPHLINQMPEDQAIPTDGFYIGTDQVDNGRQIANYMLHTLKVKKVGFVGENDATAAPARTAFVEEAKRIGLQVVHNEVVDGMGNQFLAEAQKMKNDGAQSMWMYVAPNNAINLSKESAADGYHPTWVSSSVAWGFNLVLTPSSGALDGAKSFSPWGGLSDPRYATYNKVNTEGRTQDDKDIGLPAWGYGQIISAALKAAGPGLGRNSFRNAMQNLKTGSTDEVTKSPFCWPPLDFTGGKRYGSGDRTIVLTVQGTGANAVWATESDYRSVY
jgi:ABC-type branched-subunit amino acid transport system substrate-binding protein